VSNGPTVGSCTPAIRSSIRSPRRRGVAASREYRCRALAVLRLNRSPALKFPLLAAINDSSHVKHFTFFHYRLSVEQNSFATAD
jgi:hypothetical protein